MRRDCASSAGRWKFPCARGGCGGPWRRRALRIPLRSPSRSPRRVPELRGPAARRFTRAAAQQADREGGGAGEPVFQPWTEAAGQPAAFPRSWAVLPDPYLSLLQLQVSSCISAEDLEAQKLRNAGGVLGTRLCQQSLVMDNCHSIGSQGNGSSGVKWFLKGRGTTQWWDEKESTDQQKRRSMGSWLRMNFLQLQSSGSDPKN
uniref:uncharacterized protein LOC129502016 n=1 Tax=Nyctereutes procyonoides TaxID=34880 RepID=UPI002444A421|nr:uncharacterized protein LOC129502016 [Nyctereutes procyonoides]